MRTRFNYRRGFVLHRIGAQLLDARWETFAVHSPGIRLRRAKRLLEQTIDFRRIRLW